MSRKQSKATEQANMRRASERAAAIRAQQERKERRTRALLVSSAVVAVLILVVAVVAAVQASRDTTGQAATPPAGVVDRYSVQMGSSSAPAKVTIYEDFMCPYCGDFERVSEQKLKQYAATGKAQVSYHVVSFLDRSSTTDYSTRAANALAVVLDTAGPGVALRFHNLLYAHQPQEGTAGLSDQQLVGLAVQAGAKSKAVTGPIKDLKFEQWVVNSTNAWSKRGYNSTPTVTVNGKKVAFSSAADLMTNVDAAIQKAQSK